METTYELWDVGAGNAIGEFATLDAGLDIVRHLLDSFGQDYANDLDLSRREGDGPTMTIATGDQLLELLDQAGREATQPTLSVSAHD